MPSRFLHSELAEKKKISGKKMIPVWKIWKSIYLSSEIEINSPKQQVHRLSKREENIVVLIKKNFPHLEYGCYNPNSLRT